MPQAGRPSAGLVAASAVVLSVLVPMSGLLGCHSKRIDSPPVVTGPRSEMSGLVQSSVNAAIGRPMAASVGSPLATAPASAPSTARASSSSRASRSQPVTLWGALSHRYYSGPPGTPVILKVEIAGGTAPPTVRPPLNLALVFDRSGSMAKEKKFTYAMHAARTVIENLRPEDTISLIAFNERAVVLSPAGLAVNRDFLYHRLDMLEPSGATNLSAGLLEGFAQVRARRRARQSQHVIVLTDGLANRGVTDSEKLKEMVAQAYGDGISVSTLGVGADFDEKLLNALAAGGGGRYRYVESPDQIPTAVADELQGLLSVVAQNVSLKVSPIGSAWIERVYGLLLPEPIPEYQVPLGDVRAEERHVLLFALKPVELTPGAKLDVVIDLTYDVPETAARQTQRVMLAAQFSADAKQVERGRDETLLLYGQISDALETIQEAVEGFDAERYRTIKKQYKKLHKRARQRALATRDQELLNRAFLLKHFMKMLTDAAEQGLLHGHEEARRRLKKDFQYRRYLLDHHRHRAP